MTAAASYGASAMARGSSSFGAASRLFDPGLREDAWRLYAWCRHCDDEIDGQDGGGASISLSALERAERLERLRRQTRSALAGEPQREPPFAAFAEVATRHDLPAQWPLELLDGFARDVDPRPCRDQAETLAYCWGVAGTVGVMMAQIMGAKGLPVLRRAQDLGLAFQLTNICRDVAEDAQNGRVYLPEDRLRAAGAPSTPAGVLAAQNRSAVFAVVLEQLDLAERYYRSARVGLRDLPLRSAIAIAAARDIYREIGRRIGRRGPQALDARMRLPRWLLLIRLGRGVLVALWSRVERMRGAAPRPALWSRL